VSSGALTAWRCLGPGTRGRSAAAALRQAATTRVTTSAQIRATAQMRVSKKGIGIESSVRSSKAYGRSWSVLPTYRQPRQAA
jgi:hypothetical protein